MDRRLFLEYFSASIIAPSLLIGQDYVEDSEKYWKNISKMYPDSKSKVLNLNCGSAGMVPYPVEKVLLQNIKKMHRMPPYQFDLKSKLVIEESLIKLGKLIDVNPSNLVLNRNTTEGLSTIIRGIQLPKKSNIVVAEFDYPYALNAVEHKAEKDGLNIKTVKLELPASEIQILEAYKEQIDEQTSLVLLTAITHREGQLLPIQNLVRLAQESNAKTLVDAAHAIGQIPHSLKEWDCDFYCTSLHKWLSAPHGNGLMFIKEEEIKNVAGVSASYQKEADDIMKFQHLGTRNFALEASVLSAINFHNAIGTQRKFDRLQSLTKYWTEEVGKIDGVEVTNKEIHTAVSSFQTRDLPGLNVLDFLKQKGIIVKTVRSPSMKRSAFRVSPNIYHDFNDLDKFISTLKELVRI